MTRTIALCLAVALGACGTVAKRTDRHEGAGFAGYSVPAGDHANITTTTVNFIN